MRVLMTFLSLLSLRVCGEGDEQPPQVAAPPTEVTVQAEAEVTPPAPPTVVISEELRRPRHGGTVMIADDHVVEVVPQNNGRVYAYVLDAHQQVPPPANVSLNINLTGRDNRLHPVILGWNAEVMRWEGELVGVVPRPGPVEVNLVVGGRPRFATVDTYVIVTAPPPPGPRVVVVGEAPRPRADVVVVAPPPPRAHVQINVGAPPPPRAHVDIRVGAPRPPSGQIRVVAGGAPPPRTVIVHDHSDSDSDHHHRGRGLGHVRGNGRGHDRHGDGRVQVRVRH